MSTILSLDACRYLAQRRHVSLFRLFGIFIWDFKVAQNVLQSQRQTLLFLYDEPIRYSLRLGFAVATTYDKIRCKDSGKDRVNFNISDVPCECEQWGFLVLWYDIQDKNPNQCNLLPQKKQLQLRALLISHLKGYPFTQKSMYFQIVIHIISI